jgi:hypothetical protein
MPTSEPSGQPTSRPTFKTLGQVTNAAIVGAVICASCAAAIFFGGLIYWSNHKKNYGPISDNDDTFDDEL